MKGSIKIGRFAGIDVFVHWTFSLLLVYVIFTSIKSGLNINQTLWMLAFVLSVFVTVVLHEFGHALTAKKFNCNTKDITLLPIGGVARLEKFPDKPIQELWIAIAGPAVNIGIAVILGLFIHFPDGSELVTELNNNISSSNFLLNFFGVNIWLALFNLIPAFPMDGGRVLRALLSLKLSPTLATNIASKIGQLIALVFVIGGLFYNPMLIIVGVFIFIGAQQENAMMQMKHTLTGYKVRDVLMTEYATLNAEDTIHTAVQRILSSQYKNFLILEGQQHIGTLSRDEIIQALAAGGQNESVSAFMKKNLVELHPETPLNSILNLAGSDSTELMPVVIDGVRIGVIDRENVAEFLLLQHSLRQ
ncbi:MAG: site-2 protease family protein [Bacteroidia bacterium]